MSINWPVAVPVAAAVIAASAAVWGAWLTSRAQAASRKLSQELKIADYRQDWINQLRVKLATYFALINEVESALDDRESRARTFELIKCSYEIELLLAPNDPKYDDLVAELRAQRCAFTERGIDPKSLEIVLLSRETLKRGWDRIKADIRNIESETG